MSAAAAALCAVLYWNLPSTIARGHENLGRAGVLFGGVLLSQLFALVGEGIIESGSGIDALVLLIPFTGLGWLTLSGP